MPNHLPDIDIDFQPSFEPLSVFPEATPASMVNDGVLKQHPCGLYFQRVPTDPLTKLCAIPYKEAEQYGMFKIDFLHLSVLTVFESKSEIRALLKAPPDWSLLQDDEAVSKLFQLSKHGSILKRVKPTSVEQVADVIAMIRPAKRHLVDEYTSNPTETRPKLYRQGEDDKSSFKRSHAIAYALTVVLQLHLIKGKII